MRFISLALILLSLCLGPIAQAGLTQTYREKTFQVLQFLEEIGVEKIACDQDQCLSPRSLMNLLKKVHFVETPFFKSAQASRFEAYSDPKTQTIYLNTIYAQPKVSQFTGFVGLHELLWMAGRPDNNFEISLRAYLLYRNYRFMAQERDYMVMMIQDMQMRPQFTAFNPADSEITLKGGVILVGGGGGDTRSLAIRMQLFDHLSSVLLPNQEIYGPEFMKAVRDLLLTVYIEGSGEFDRIQYEIQGQDRHTIRVIVPKSFIEEDTYEGELKKAALDDVSWYLLTLMDWSNQSPHPAAADTRIKWY